MIPRRWVLIFPDWLDAAGESVLRQNLPALNALAERGELRKLDADYSAVTTEALFLGFEPDEIELEPGPLTIAALGVDPPKDSTHFHLSPMALVDGVLHQHALALPPEQVDLVMGQAKKLNTRTLTVVPGEGVDHGLVWEGRGDLHTGGPTSVSESLLRDCLPEGDNEPALRRFIDDSINLLSELEFNQQRVDEGLLPINILWPWGQGIRVPVPNLALQRGSPAKVFTDSLRLSGLSRLAGYRAQPRSILGNGMNARWNEVVAGMADSTIVVGGAFSKLRRENQLEEAAWLSKEIDSKLLAPLLTSAMEVPTQLAILAPGWGRTGLSITYRTGDMNNGHLPFDERSIDERLPQLGLSDAVRSVLEP